MQQNDRRVILMLLASIILFIAGIYIYNPVAEFLLPDIDGVAYQITEVGTSFNDSLVFSFYLALVPVCILITWAICKARVKQDRDAISSIIIVITILTVFVRQQILYYYLKKLSDDLTSDAADFGIRYPLNVNGFVLYIFAGLLGGCILTCIIYRRRN